MPAAARLAFRSPAARGTLAALAGGVLAAFSLPPWGWWPLGVVGLALFAGSLHGQPVVRRAAAGAAFGVGSFGIGLWWITEFHAVGFVALLVLETAFVVAGAAVTTRAVAFPAAVVLAEAARGAVPFGGLPLGGLALGQAGGPLVGAARIGGALLVVGLLAVLGASLAALVALVTRSTQSTSRQSRRVVGPVAAVMLALAAAGVGWVAPAGEPAGSLDAMLVQGGGRRGFRAVESDPGDVLGAHLAASARIEPGTVDLVLWPENAIDVIQIEYSEAGDALAALARTTRATVVAGVTQEAGDAGFENTAIAWDGSGEIVDRYTKVRRVPFGEYVPMRSFLDRLVDLTVLPRDAVAGTGPGELDTPAGHFAVAISYEVFFSDRVRSGVTAGGEAILVPTNAASFTTSQVPTQEVAAARLRAWESGRWVLQAAPTGYTAVIDHRGRVLERSVLGQSQLLDATVVRRSGSTPYTTAGDLPLLALAALVVAGSAFGVVRGSRA